MTTLRETLHRLRALEQQATKAPWKRDPSANTSMQVVAAGNEVVLYHARHERQRNEAVVTNMNLIAASRNALPALLAVVQAVTDAARISHNCSDVDVCSACEEMDDALALLDAEVGE
jgi:hypothetical protein